MGGSVGPIYNAVAVAELAVGKGAQTILLPLAVRWQINELSDDASAKLAILYYTDGHDALCNLQWYLALILQRYLALCRPDFLTWIPPLLIDLLR